MLFTALMITQIWREMSHTKLIGSQSFNLTNDNDNEKMMKKIICDEK